MVIQGIARSDLFIDTSYAVALAIRTDQYHDRAARIAARLRLDPPQFITTQAVVFEIGNMLSTLQHRQQGIRLLRSQYRDRRVEIISLTDVLIEEAFQLYRNRHDEEWGLTDCVSFVVMHQRGILDALTTDHHFHQAGFRALLLE